MPKFAVGEHIGVASYGGSETSFANVIDRAPIIAEVLVTKYYGSIEETTNFSCTLYEAQITTCYKNTTGKELTSIRFVQDGTPEWTFSGYTLFQTGDRLLLALAPCSYYEGPIADSLDGYYLIDGGARTAMQIIQSDDGDVCRTFSPSLQDLPLKHVTSSMKNAAEKHFVAKHRSASQSDVQNAPPYIVTSYFDLKEMIQEEIRI